jgi:spermidine synthase
VIKLRLLVLVAGMTTMATEMSASRLLAPFFGASILVWANLIGLILVYLSLGYWIGGRVADRRPQLSGLCTITLAAAATIALLPFVAHPILSSTSGAIDESSVGVIIGSFAGTLLLFSIPVTLLGMVPPYAIRLAITNVEKAGAAAGGLYALSTIGSILGTFGSVLFLIPLVGTRRTMLAFALVLALLSLFSIQRRILEVAVIVAIGVGLVVPVGAIKEAKAGELGLFERESPYQYVQVVEQKRSGIRLLQLNEAWAVHSVYNPTTNLVGGIFDRYVAIPNLLGRSNPGEADALLLGSAAGTIPHTYREFWPHIHFDGVEIDPDVIAAGRKLFHMDGRNLTVHQADARPFLANARHRKWDIIIIDAYRQPYIPFYLTTREFFALVRTHLSDDGVVVINIGAAPGDQRIQLAIGATMMDVFPAVYRHRAAEFNEFLIATREQTSLDEVKARLRSHRSNDGDVQSISREVASDIRPMKSHSEVLTDDKAPVEWMTDGMILRYARESRPQ